MLSSSTLPMPIDATTWKELFEAVYEINSAPSHADFGESVVAGMSRLIRTELSVFQVLDRATGRIMTRMAPEDPFTAEEVLYYTCHSEEMPLVAYFSRTGAPQARRITDVIDHDVWMRSDYYRICLSRLDLPYCLAVPIVVTESIVAALSFNRRGLDFSDHDCELLNAFGPHLRQSWQRHKNPWRDGKAEERSARQHFEKLGLRPRESEVLYWMTQGKQNREIATILGIQLSTVQEYVAGILDKLEQENRHSATVFALQQLATG